MVPGIRSHALHVVRDPRAVAYSYQRARNTPDRQLRREGAMENSMRYVYRNMAAHEVCRRYARDRSSLLRYEDFVNYPAMTLQRITHFLGEEPSTLPVDGNGVATLRVNHTAAGNPSRFRVGSINLKLDDEWIYRQRRFDRVSATLITLPLLARYRYRLAPGRGRG